MEILFPVEKGIILPALKKSRLVCRVFFFSLPKIRQFTKLLKMVQLFPRAVPLPPPPHPHPLLSQPGDSQLLA